MCLGCLHPTVKVSPGPGRGKPRNSILHLPLLPQLQELLEYMRKLEARLEKVADEKWSEDAATEDEEAAAGLSLYTPSHDTFEAAWPSLPIPWALSS